MSTPYRHRVAAETIASPRRIRLLKRYKPEGDAPRDMPGYDGRGASKALLHAIDRARNAPDGYRAQLLNELALEQVEREQTQEGL